MAQFKTHDYYSTLPATEKKRYKEKVEAITKSKFANALDPYKIDGWIDDISLWPPIEFGSIYSYLIDTPSQFTKEKLKAYKSLEAYNYYTRSVL